MSAKAPRLIATREAALAIGAPTIVHHVAESGHFVNATETLSQLAEHTQSAQARAHA